VLGIAIALFKLPAMPQAERHGTGPQESVWKHRNLVLGTVGIFVYVGAEVAIGSFLINYLSQPNIGNVSVQVAAKYVSYYWGGAMVGRFVGSAILQKVRTGTVLGIAAATACLLVCISMLTFGHFAMWSILLVGFFNSIMFPSIFTLGIAELGPLTGDGSGLLVMAIVAARLFRCFKALWLIDWGFITHSFFPSFVICISCITRLKDRALSSRPKTAHVRTIFFSVVLLASASQMFAQDSALASTPPMGWNSWNKFACNVSEDLIKQQLMPW